MDAPVPRLTVAWPSAIATRAELWRVLDLGGLTNSVRDSRNFVKAGYAFFNGERILTLHDTVEVGRLFLLELRFPNRVTISREIFLTRPVRYKPRSNQPLTKHYRP